jgi:hypothetical protein
MKKMTEEQKQHFKGLLLQILTGHIGRARMIGMGELYEDVFGEPWQNRINDTRRLRKIITELRLEGVPICSDSSSAGGYYLASAGSELEGYCKRMRRAALRKMVLEASVRKITLAELVGQMQLELGAPGEAA